MLIKKSDLNALNYLALAAIKELQKQSNFQARYEEWKKEKAPSDKTKALK